jgi:esterase/lipase superfamily enzyme
MGVRRDHVTVHAPATGGEGDLIAYGHYGRPLLVFPSEQGHAWDFENNGMIGAISWLIDGGRVKVYCVDSFDAGSWARDDLPLEDRARMHQGYEDWIVNGVVPWIDSDCGGHKEIITTGCSFGAYHAANFALKRADLFPLAICFSGVYDVSRAGWGPRGDAVYFNNPMDYVAHLGGDHLDWLRGRVSILLVCGQGQWEDTTGALESTTEFAGLLSSKAIKHELDLWGYDVPHDWPSWRNQIAHHLQRLC